QQAPAPQPQSTAGAVHDQTTEMSRPAPGFRSQAKTRATGTSGASIAQFAIQAAQSHRLAKKAENGSYINVPASTVFQEGDVIRVTITVRTTGPLVLSEW